MSLKFNRRELISGAAALAAYSMLPRSARAADAVPSSRLVYGGRWQGIVGVSGGIPHRTTQYGGTISPYSGSAGTINTAIANCPDDQVVQLGAGTFNLNSSITIANSRVTLRGAVDSNGMPTTILNFTGGSSRLILFEASGGWDLANSARFTSANITGGVNRGSTSITLSVTPTSLVVGQFMIISAPRSSTVTGDGWSDFFGSRPFTQMVRVVATSGSTVTFSPAINADYLSGTIQAHWRSITDSVKLSGIEDLSLTGATAAGGHYVGFNGADECWAKNVKSYGVPSSTYHYFPYLAYRCEIRHCDVAHMTNLTNSTYCVCAVHSSQLLIEDNYFHDVPNVMPMFGLNGSAFSYNYINNLPYDPSGWLSQIVFFHGSHSHYNLFEGNWCPASYNDSGAGSRNNLWLRNRMRGWDASGPKSGNTEPMTLCDNHANLTMAGNVLGENGVQTSVLATFSSADNFPSNVIYNLHNTSAATTSKIGNYNTVNDAVPALEALSSGDVLVDSYLYSSKPAWFGSLPWPWCDPSNYSQSNNFQNLPAGYRAANGKDPAADSKVPMPPTDIQATG